MKDSTTSNPITLELVVRQSDNELVVLDNELWIAPLRDELKSALLTEIRLRMPSRTGNAAVPKKITIHIDVERFESALARYALVQIAWRLTMFSPPNEVTSDCQTTAKIDVIGGVAALVYGHQQAIAKVGDQIASDILERQQSEATQCPAGQEGR